MKRLLVFVSLVAAVYSFVLPVKILTTGVVQEAPGVIYQLAGVPGTSFWVTDVTVGTPGQTFTLAIDTDGYYLWIPDLSCVQTTNTSTLPCYGKKRFDPSTSSTYQYGFSIFNKDHLDQVTGVYGSDVVRLGSIANQTTVSHPQWIQATTISGTISNTPGVDGVLGLAGPTDLALADQITSPANVWTKNVITLWLENQWETSDNGTEGAIYYGNYDPLHYNYSYSVPNTYPNHYQFTTTRFQMNLNGQVVTDSRVHRQAILVSTWPYISVPRNIEIQVMVALGLDANTTTPAVVPCNLAGTFNFTITTAKGKETIQSINLIVPRDDGKCILAMTAINAANFPQDSSAGHIELGIPFFRGRCTYLDRTEQTIGFGFPGHRVPQPSTTVTPSEEKTEPK